MSASTDNIGTLVQPTRLSDDQVKTYRDEGYLILRGLISKDDALTLKHEVLDIMDQIGLGISKLKQTGEYLEGSGLDSLVNSRNLKSVAEQLLGGPGTIFLPFTAVKSGGGGGRFHFHQDNQYTRFDGPGINLWFALDTMTPENGCLQVIPRSHLSGTLESDVSGDGDTHRKITWEPEDYISVLMEPGDCIAFTRLTVHGSGPNMTDKPRVAYAVQYHRDDVRIELNGSPVLLKEFPRYSVGPVDAISAPKEKLEGH